jgi:hypothetical protein
VPSLKSHSPNRVASTGLALASEAVAGFDQFPRPAAAPIRGHAVAPADRRLARGSRIAALLTATVIAIAFAIHARQHPGAIVRAPSTSTEPAARSGLSAAATAQISDAIGAQTPSYLVRHSGRGLDVGNPAQRLTGAFDAAGAWVRGSWGAVHIDLAGTGSGADARRLAPVEPTGALNRVAYDGASVGEWYANGPLGIEQGFTVARGPALSASDTLTLRLALGGDVRARLMPGGRGVQFTRRGKPVLSYGALAAHDARGVPLASTMRLLGNRLLLEVDTRGARYPLTVDPLIQAVPKLVEGTAENLDGGDFGFSVALSADGSTAVVGGKEYEKKDGAAWVFVRSGDAWVQQGPRMNGNEGSEFGESVAISPDGSTVVVGAPSASGGAVWVFERSGTTWSGGAKLSKSPLVPAVGDFGETVALSSNGEVLFAGEPEYEDNHGAVWIYTRSGAEWVHEEKPIPCPESELALFGSAVALSETGATAIIGGFALHSADGGAWVFQRSGSGWVVQGGQLNGTEEEPNTPGTGEGAAFGSSVAISADGNTALVGGFFDHDSAGAAWAFTRSGTSWSQQGPKITAAGEVNGAGIGVGGFFGTALAVTPEGNTAIVGAAGDSDFDGAAWIFKRSEGRWTQQAGKLRGGEESEGGGFGNSVAIAADGRTALIGGGSALAGAPPIIGGAWVFELEPPSAMVGGATQIGVNSATLAGQVDPEGSEVSECTIEYGLASLFTSHMPCSQVAGEGIVPEAVAAQVNGLSPSTTYDFRIRALSEGGVSTSAASSFTTAAAAVFTVREAPGGPAPSPSPYVKAHVYRSFAPQTGIFDFLVVGEVPLGGYVVLTCHGSGCPFTRHQSAPRRSTSTCRLPSASRRAAAVHECVSLTAFMARRRIRPGDTVTVEIERMGWVAKRFTYMLGPNGKLIVSGGRCLVAGKAPVRC